MKKTSTAASRLPLGPHDHLIIPSSFAFHDKDSSMTSQLSKLRNIVKAKNEEYVATTTRNNKRRSSITRGSNKEN